MKPYATYNLLIVMRITSYEVYTLVPFSVYCHVALVAISPTWFQVLHSPWLLGCMVLRPIKSAMVYQGYWCYKPPYGAYCHGCLDMRLHFVTGDIHHG